MTIARVNPHIFDRLLSTAERDVVIFYSDRVILSGYSGNQVFTNKEPSGPDFCKHFLSISGEEKRELAQIHREGVMNKERSIRNITKVETTDHVQKQLKELILGCDCSPSAIREKIRSKFAWTNTEIAKLDLEDPHKDMIKTVMGMTDFCKEFLDQY